MFVLLLICRWPVCSVIIGGDVRSHVELLAAVVVQWMLSMFQHSIQN